MISGGHAAGLRVGLAIALACIVTACATPYQEMNPFTGGVSASRIDETTVQISARGNGYTDPDTISRYAMRKAAETTVQAGYDLFLVLGSQDRSSTGVIYTPGSSYTTGSVNSYGSFSSNTTYQAPQAMAFNRPGETVTIKMFKGAKPAGAPANLYDAREVARYLTPAPK